jgi:beta-barrel assembly-enhancing protease
VPTTNRRGAARLAARVTAAALLVAVAGGCTVSDDQEAEIGRQNAAQVAGQLPLVRDPVVNRYVSDLGLDIARRTSRPDLDWRFYVVDSPEVNAFAIPGGYVYVNRGLIERTRSLDELAGVIAHEIGHVVRRHSVKQMQQQQTTNIGVALLCRFTEACQSDAARVAINVGGAALFARYSRQDEAEADSVAVENVIRTGIDPDGIPGMFERLLAERRAHPTVLDSFFGTHPLEERRIDATRRVIAGYDQASLEGLVTDTPEFHAFKARLESLPPSPVPRPTRLP